MPTQKSACRNLKTGDRVLLVQPNQRFNRLYKKRVCGVVNGNILVPSGRKGGAPRLFRISDGLEADSASPGTARIVPFGGEAEKIIEENINARRPKN